MDAIVEMKEMVRRLNEAADAYYSGRGELMTDFEWDAMFDALKKLEAETGVVLPDSPTSKVSSDSLAGRREAHETPALSLAKTKSVAELAKWCEGRPVWISWKLDGLTLVATYDGGFLTRIVTRGDGHYGTNITHLAGGILGVPAKIACEGHLVVRGEAVISYADFESFIASSQEDYANPRNLASGSLTLKDIEELKARRLRWKPFTLVKSDREFKSWGECMDYLDSLGFETVERELVCAPGEAELKGAIDRWTVKVTDGENPYPVDGLVVTYDDVAYSATGSVTGHHATRAGIAFKWQDETAATKLERIEWSCAVASISPVAVFEPVNLEGTVVKRASLCNVSECERLGIGGPGTELKVIKANKIIPKVVEVTRGEGALEIPATCPVCGAATELKVSQSGTKTLRCSNAKCPARELRKFMRFVSKAGADIDGLAGETIAKFVNSGWVKRFGDLYRLGSHRDEIAAMEGFGDKSADKIVAAVESARECDAVKLLVALSIPLCGPDVARRLLSRHGFRELFEAAAQDGAEEVFASIDGIGPGKAAAFVSWCKDGENIAMLDDLLGEVRVKEYSAPQGGRCGGMVFVVTGELGIFAGRDAFKEYVVAQGGKVSGSVSSKTSFLVTNDTSSGSSKNRKAAELSIPVITEAEFIERFGWGGSPS